MGRLTSPMTSLIIVTSMSHVKPYTRAPIGQQEPPQGEADLAYDVINCYEYVTCLTIHQSSLRTAGTRNLHRGEADLAYDVINCQNSYTMWNH